MGQFQYTLAGHGSNAEYSPERHMKMLMDSSSGDGPQIEGIQVQELSPEDMAQMMDGMSGEMGELGEGIGYQLKLKMEKGPPLLLTKLPIDNKPDSDPNPFAPEKPDHNMVLRCGIDNPGGNLSPDEFKDALFSLKQVVVPDALRMHVVRLEGHHTFPAGDDRFRVESEQLNEFKDRLEGEGVNVDSGFTVNSKPGGMTFTKGPAEEGTQGFSIAPPKPEPEPEVEGTSKKKNTGFHPTPFQDPKNPFG